RGAAGLTPNHQRHAYLCPWSTMATRRGALRPGYHLHHDHQHPHEPLTRTTMNASDLFTRLKRRSCWDCGRLICHPSCPGAPESPDPGEDPYANVPEALGWQPATTEDLYPVPEAAEESGGRLT